MGAQEVSALLAPHDSAFFVVASPSEAPPAPMPAPSPTPAPSPLPTPAPAPTPVGPCIQSNTLYDSHKDGNVLLDRQYKPVRDSTACQQLCHATDDCVCFSHRKSLGHCWLMTSCQHAQEDSAYDSGWASCSLDVQV